MVSLLLETGSHIPMLKQIRILNGGGFLEWSTAGGGSSSRFNGICNSSNSSSRSSSNNFHSRNSSRSSSIVSFLQSQPYTQPLHTPTSAVLPAPVSLCPLGLPVRSKGVISQIKTRQNNSPH